MTLEELNRYRKLRRKIKSLEDQLEVLRFTPLPSIGEKIGSKPSGVSDPTRSQAMKIMNEEARLEKVKREAEAEKERIEAWMETVEDPDVYALIRWRFMLGWSWARINREAYDGMASENLARNTVYNYLRRTES